MELTIETTSLTPTQNALSKIPIEMKANPSIKKIKTREEINQIAAQLRAQGKTIVTTNGSFDLIQYGHVYLFEKAKGMGDVLIVGLNSDKSIHEYKSPDRPIIPEEYRAGLLASLESIDYVTIFDETVPMPFIEGVKPHIHTNSAEYGADCIEKPTVEMNGGKVVSIPKVGGLSTSKIFKKIVELELKEKGATKKEDVILNTIKNQNGILFAEPAIVHRCQYSGRDIIAKNSSFTNHTDDRQYVPVEWWIMSKTPAENELPKENEGLSYIYLGEEKILFKKAVEIATNALLGAYTNSWPLTKILDIGGDPINPSFSDTLEVPPIPCHVHSGETKNGNAVGLGKLEAYFFPPVHVPPYNANFGKAISRLGLKPDTTKEMFIERLKNFGKDDSMYELLNVFEMKPYEGWTLLPGVVHAPGPWVTFEIQRPQDDFNLASWQLGQTFTDEELPEKRKSLQFRGLANEEAFVNEVVDWETSTDPHFKEKWHRPSHVLSAGTWGRQLQIFFDAFYGEAFEINPGHIFKRAADERPFAGIVWSGRGTLNGNPIDVNDNERKELLVTPNTEVVIENTGTTPLLIYTVFPIDQKSEDKI
jgi:D-glycero-beta-D-manno-heptose 1-phosphate adenylyltransferase